MADKFVYGTPFAGHIPSLSSIGWGEPATIFTRCSCGWNGLVIEERWYAEDEKEFKDANEPWGTAMRTYGAEVSLPDNHAFGSRWDAEVQLLAHLNYDPAVDRAHADQVFEEAVESLRTAKTIAEADEARRAVDKHANEIAAAVERGILWETTPQPEAPFRHPEGLAIVRAADAKRRAEDAERSKRPLTPAEKAALERAGIIS